MSSSRQPAQRDLNVVLLGATAFALLAPGEPVAGRVLLAIGTLAAILVFPFVVVAFGSRREAEESMLRRRLKKAIVDEEEEPRKKEKKKGWDDED